jgi:beta-lactam-binding protein with PASTA domain
VSVPSVVGLTKAAADSAITNAELVPQATCHLDPTAPGGGVVTAQDPAKDTKVDGHSTVKYDYDAPACA